MGVQKFGDIVVANIGIVLHVHGEAHEQRRSANAAPGKLQNLFEVDTLHFVMANVELTGAARIYRAASSDRRERG